MCFSFLSEKQTTALSACNELCSTDTASRHLKQYTKDPRPNYAVQYTPQVEVQHSYFTQKIVPCTPQVEILYSHFKRCFQGGFSLEFNMFVFVGLCPSNPILLQLQLGQTAQLFCEGYLEYCDTVFRMKNRLNTTQTSYYCMSSKSLFSQFSQTSQTYNTIISTVVVPDETLGLKGEGVWVDSTV